MESGPHCSTPWTLEYSPPPSEPIFGRVGVSRETLPGTLVWRSPSRSLGWTAAARSVMRCESGPGQRA